MPEVLDEGALVTDVTRRYGVARQTVHQWLRRYANGGGLAGLADQSSRPESCPVGFQLSHAPLTWRYSRAIVDLYAACLYSLISPPRTRWRLTLPSLGSAAAGLIASECGGPRLRARCGWCWL